LRGLAHDQEGTSQIGQEPQDGGIKCGARSLGHVRELSQKLWDDSLRSGGSNGEGGCSTRRTNPEANIGKILDHLKQLREQYLAYVDAHGERLQARFRENRQHRDEAVATMDQLESEIIELLNKSEGAEE
jgi:hypothetical protein